MRPENCPDAPTNGRPWPGRRVSAKLEGVVRHGIVDTYDWWHNGAAFPFMFWVDGVVHMRMLSPGEILTDQSAAEKPQTRKGDAKVPTPRSAARAARTGPQRTVKAAARPA